MSSQRSLSCGRDRPNGLCPCTTLVSAIVAPPPPIGPSALAIWWPNSRSISSSRRRTYRKWPELRFGEKIKNKLPLSWLTCNCHVQKMRIITHRYYRIPHYFGTSRQSLAPPKYSSAQTRRCYRRCAGWPMRNTFSTPNHCGYQLPAWWRSTQPLLAAGRPPLENFHCKWNLLTSPSAAPVFRLHSRAQGGWRLEDCVINSELICSDEWIGWVLGVRSYNRRAHAIESQFRQRKAVVESHLPNRSI